MYNHNHSHGNCYTPTESINRLFILIGGLEKEMECYQNIVNKRVDIQEENIKYLMTTGLETEIQKRLSLMVEDGTIEKIINSEIFGKLNTDLEKLKNELSTQNTDVSNLKISVSEVNKNITKINEGITLLNEEIINISNTYDSLSLTVLQNSEDIKILKENPNDNVLSESTGVKMIAHRGLSMVAPENTLKAYELASQNKYEYVETDIQLNYSNDWVLMHDDTVDRTTTGTGKVSELTTDYIKSLLIDSGNNVDLYPGEKVPFLDDFLKLCKDKNLKPLIEVKYNKNESALQKLINLVKLYGLQNETRIISFSIETLEIIRRLDKNIKVTIVSEGDITEQLIIKALDIKNCDFSMSAPSGVMIKKAHENNIKVNCWTVNDFVKANELISSGIDFITTDILKEVF